MRGISGFILPLGLLLTTSEAALAQSSNAAPQEGATSDIVVTARRTAENIQETPETCYGPVQVAYSHS